MIHGESPFENRGYDIVCLVAHDPRKSSPHQSAILAITDTMPDRLRRTYNNLFYLKCIFIFHGRLGVLNRMQRRTLRTRLSVHVSVHKISTHDIFMATHAQRFINKLRLGRPTGFTTYGLTRHFLEPDPKVSGSAHMF